MKKLFGKWFTGVNYILYDNMISFYVFFTAALTQCAVLWAFYPKTIAIQFTIILVGYILNVLLFGRLKRFHEGTRSEVASSIIYVIVFLALFIIGCFFNWLISIATTSILLAITALWIGIRKQQNFIYAGEDFPKILYVINSIFGNKIFWVLSQIVVILGPIIAFSICFAMIPVLSIEVKILVVAAYCIVIPFIAYIEDILYACNVFEIAFDITWRRKYEDLITGYE